MPGDAQLWLVDLEQASGALLACEAELPRLAASDRARIAALSEPRARRERELSAIALRWVLARLAGDSRYDRIAFHRAENGKPSLAEAPVTFSLSHSSGWALIAAAPVGGALLGADLQRISPLKLPAERRARIVAAGARLAGQPVPVPAPEREDDRAVVRAFVRIEAVAKASGLGLAHVLSRLGIIAAGASTEESAIAGARFKDVLERLTIRDLDVSAATDGSYCAALAWSGEASLDATRLEMFPSDRPGIEALLAR